MICSASSSPRSRIVSSQRASRLEAVRPVARYRHQDLLEGLDVSVHQTSATARPMAVNLARDIFAAPGDLDEKPHGGTFGAEDGLHSRATLPTDRCYLNDTAVRINTATAETTPLSGKNT